MSDIKTAAEQIVTKINSAMSATTDPDKLNNLFISQQSILNSLEKFNTTTKVDYGFILSEHAQFSRAGSAAGYNWTNFGPKSRDSDGDLANILLGRLMQTEDKLWNNDATDFDAGPARPPQFVPGYGKRPFIAIQDTKFEFTNSGNQKSNPYWHCAWVPVKNTTNADINMALDICYTQWDDGTNDDWAPKADFFYYVPNQPNSNRANITAITAHANLLHKVGWTKDEQETVTIKIPADTTVLLCLAARRWWWSDSNACYGMGVRNMWKNIGYDYLANPNSGIVCDRQLLKQMLACNHTNNFEAWTKTEATEPKLPMWGTFQC